MKNKSFPLRFSSMGRGLLEAIQKKNSPLASEEMIVSGSVGVHICTRLPGDMGLRLADVVASFLDEEHIAGRLPL
jgi:hypothetical protein